MSNSPARGREIYSRSPIVEAVIDIRCAVAPAFTFSSLPQLISRLAGDYVEHARAVEVTEERRGDGSSTHTSSPVGYVLRGVSDEKRIVHIQVGGFSCSRLAPYTRWEEFVVEARRVWRIYADLAQPEALQRIGVRYINRIELGSVIVKNLKPFVNVHPVTPWSLSLPSSGFSLQIRRKLADGDTMIVNEATMQHAETQEQAILIDFDAYSENVGASDDEQMWMVVERLHAAIDSAFESAITERVREMIR